MAAFFGRIWRRFIHSIDSEPLISSHLVLYPITFQAGRPGVGGERGIGYSIIIVVVG